MSAEPRPDESRSAATSGAAVARLDEVTRLLRRECPWDREQDERSIVPHTVEEAYELADAAGRGDDRKLLDELGDVLFQVHFLALLLEERDAGGLAEVADHCRNKLVRRHPHVFADTAVEGADEVLRNWDAIKRSESGREPGLFGELPDNLPGPLYATKTLRRAGAAAALPADPAGALARVVALGGAVDAEAGAGERFEAVGELLLATVAAARALSVDPELSLRAAADRLRGRIERDEEVRAARE